MVLYMIGLGLGDEDDITVKGLKIVQRADLVFLEAYTSVLLNGEESDDKDVITHGEMMSEITNRLERAYGLKEGTKIVVADRDMIEQQVEERILEPARNQTVALLIVGDPVCATTHTDLWLRCQEMNISMQVIHNASIMGAAGSCGLQLYNFGHTVSIPFFRDEWKPTSFYPKIKYNRRGRMHTLCLLDIKVKEPDFDAILKGKMNSYLPPRFMTISQAASQLIEVEESLCSEQAYDPHVTLCIGLARMGQEQRQQLVAGTLNELKDLDCGGPLHSLIISGGQLHDLEWDFVKQFLVEGSQCQRLDDLPIGDDQQENVTNTPVDR